MSYGFHDLDLTEDALLIIFVFDRVFIDDLDGDFLVGGGVEGLLHFAKGAFA